MNFHASPKHSKNPQNSTIPSPISLSSLNTFLSVTRDSHFVSYFIVSFFSDWLIFLWPLLTEAPTGFLLLLVSLVPSLLTKDKC